MLRSYLLVSVVLVLPVRAQPAPGASCPRGPHVETVIAAALRQQPSLHRDRALSWRRRVIWSALLPKLSARLARSESWGEYVDINPQQPDKLDLNSYLALRWEIRATWDLSKIVFNSQDLSVSQRAIQVSKERRQLLDRIVQLYFERCHLLVMSRMQRSEDPQLTASNQLKLLQLTALLNALTGGVFDREPAKND